MFYLQDYFLSKAVSHLNIKYPNEIQLLHLETKKVFSHANRVFCQKVARNAENAFEIFKLNKKRLEFLTPNLCGFDLGLEAGSR